MEPAHRKVCNCACTRAGIAGCNDHDDTRADDTRADDTRADDTRADDTRADDDVLTNSIGSFCTGITRIVQGQGYRGVARSTNGDSDDAYGVVRALLNDRGPSGRFVPSEADQECLLRYLPSGSVEFWNALAYEAEHHGVTPLIEPMIAALPHHATEAMEDLRLAFVALARRHRRAAEARELCIDQLLLAFSAAGIPVILLKGAALAHLVYFSPAVRPMADIDVLIDPADKEPAIAIAGSLGYSFAPQHASHFAGAMHHLPVATTETFGFRIALEIHVDTMSPNQACSLTFANLAAKTQRVRRGLGPDGMALGHTDMLRHLARHAFEPARRVRLIHLYDLRIYQTVFCDEINWQELADRFPGVIVALQLVSYVFPGSRPADRTSGAVVEPVLKGAGRGMVPLAEIAAANTGVFAKLDDVFNPPAWWLHGFYAVPPERSLLFCRTIRHPATVARWLSKRLVAGIEAFASTNNPHQNKRRVVDRLGVKQ